MSDFIDRMPCETLEDIRKKKEILSWQEAPITVENITPDICAICPSGDTACPGWLNQMGLGKNCYESYLKHKENN